MSTARTPATAPAPCAAVSRSSYSSLQSPEPHTLDHDEVFVVTSGRIRLTPDGDPAGPGDAVVVPAGHPIQLVNPDPTPAEVIVAIRAGFTGKAADGSDIATPPWAQ